MNLILTIDASLEYCSVALGNASVILRSESLKTTDHTKHLATMINDVIAGNRKAIKRVLVTTGPGSFTAIRASIACAMGVAIGLDAEIFGVSCFHAIMQPFSDKLDDFLIILESKSEKKYYQFLDKKGLAISVPKVDTLENILLQCDKNYTLLSNIKHVVTENKLHNCKYFVERIDSTNMIKMAEHFYSNLNPIYIRPVYV